MPGISIIVAAYNEGPLILETIRNITDGLDGSGLDAEILLIDDQSQDGTAEFCEEATRAFEDVTYVRNDVNLGFGGVYWKGVSMATREFCMIVPGDNPVGAEGLRSQFSEVGRADIICPYITNRSVRRMGRRFLSQAYTQILNLITGRNLRYYCGWVIHRTDYVRSLGSITTSFAFQAEVLCEILRKGATVVEVGVELQEYSDRKSTALKPKNVLGVVATLLRLATRSNQTGGKAALDLHTPPTR